MPSLKLTRQQWIAIILVIALIALAFYFRDTLALYLSSLDEAKAWLQGLGALGPIVLILINALQIVIAPIPGYVVQVAAGWIYGVWPGALYGTIGLALGATIAMSISRVLGRPFVTRMFGNERIDRWEHVIHADSGWLWAVLFLGPVGDLPYFLGGLSQYPIPKMVGIAVLVRGPSVLLAAAVGAGLVALDIDVICQWLYARPYVIALAGVLALSVLYLAFRYGGRVRDALEQRLLSRAER
ncbi:MAG: TVP38/TMEM64 family protein [Caldilineales bacterium]|nr:TVP38/TMEM64 family protein [Caldilineales bacterium]